MYKFKRSSSPRRSSSLSTQASVVDFDYDLSEICNESDMKLLHKEHNKLSENYISTKNTREKMIIMNEMRNFSEIIQDCLLKKLAQKSGIVHTVKSRPKRRSIKNLPAKFTDLKKELDIINESDYKKASIEYLDDMEELLDEYDFNLEKELVKDFLEKYSSFGKKRKLIKKKKISNSLKNKAKKYKIRLTIQRNGKRVPKNKNLLEKQIKIKQKLK